MDDRLCRLVGEHTHESVAGPRRALPVAEGLLELEERLVGYDGIAGPRRGTFIGSESAGRIDGGSGMRCRELGADDVEAVFVLLSDLGELTVAICRLAPG